MSWYYTFKDSAGQVSNIETDLHFTSARLLMIDVYGDENVVDMMPLNERPEGKVKKWGMKERLAWEWKKPKKMPIYHGFVKSREDLEGILQEMLPAKAVVLFAYATQQWIPDPGGGPSAGKQDVLSFWTFDHKFFGCHAMRMTIPNMVSGDPETGKWTKRDQRVQEPKRQLESLDATASAQGWPETLRLAMKDVYERMVKLEQQWNEDREGYEPPQHSAPDVNLGGVVIPNPSEN